MGLKKLWNRIRPNNTDNSLYNFPSIDIRQVSDYPNLLRDIHSRKIDGMIIENVFTKEEIDSILEKTLQLPNEERHPILGGEVFPRIFPQVVLEEFDTGEERQNFMKSYFAKSQEINSGYQSILGIDFTKRIEQTFLHIAGGREVKVPYGFGGEGQYANATVRRYFADFGFISVHSGNFFQVKFAKFYEHLMEQVNVMNQLSYFVTLSQAEKGGELTLFDLAWDQAQDKKNLTEDDFVDCLDGSKADVRQNGKTKRQFMNPPVGSVLLFAGGEIWHRVEPVLGKKDRVTIAGFMGFGHDDESVYYWS
jgi:hypothetical protein